MFTLKNQPSCLCLKGVFYQPSPSFCKRAMAPKKKLQSGAKKGAEADVDDDLDNLLKEFSTSAGVSAPEPPSPVPEVLCLYIL